MRKTLAGRFAEKTETDPRTGCQLWQAATSGGRGIMCVGDKTRLAAHVAVELAHGVAPPRGAWVLPTCGNRNCVAADHLKVDPNGLSKPRRKVPLADRLKNITIDPATGCHLFKGSLNLAGYGRIYRNGKWCGAHRIAYELAKGPIPAGMLIRHRCDTPNCVNPAHLEPGTNLDNHRDRAERGRTERARYLVPQMTAQDRATMLAALEVGYSRDALQHGYALSDAGARQALAKARQERARRG